MVDRLNETLNATERAIDHTPQLHVMWDGVTHDFDLATLDIGDLNTDNQIRQAAADALEISLGKLSNATVDRNPETGDLTLRPNAVFG